jgi:4-oxalmesaconate hydratase
MARPVPGEEAVMIIDAHAHLVAPPTLYAHRSNLIAARGQYGRYPAAISDAELEKSAAQNVAIMDEVGTDVQILSPRPFMMIHGENRWEDIVTWAEDNNDIIARTVKLHPKRFRGVGGLPQAVGVAVEKTFDEINRCVNDLGFVGILLNPDPAEGMGKTFPLADHYWFPLYEFLCKHDVPAHIHSCACCVRETYDEHFITEESLAITSITRSCFRAVSIAKAPRQPRGRLHSLPSRPLAIQSSDGDRRRSTAKGYRIFRHLIAAVLVRYGRT